MEQLMLQTESKVSLKIEFLPPQETLVFILKPSTDCTTLTHIMESNLLYSTVY